MKYLESFARAWAKQRVDNLAVTIDTATGAALFSFYGRHVEVSLRDVLLQEDALRRCADAIDTVLGVPVNRRADDAESGEGEP